MADRRILYKLLPFLQGGKVANASDIEVDATGFDGNLNTGTTDVQAVAQAVDDLMAGNANDDQTAAEVPVDSTALTGLIAGSGNVQVALNRIDATGLGASIFEFTGNYAASESNRDEWFNGRSNLHIQGADGQSNARRTFDLPGLTALGGVFDDLATAGLPETFTLLISYFGGSSNSLFSNQLRVEPRENGPDIRAGLAAYVLDRGDSVTLQISRNGGVIEDTWTELSRGIVTTTSGQSLNDIELQTRTWANLDGTFLPSSDDVLKGYAFRVTSSNPNDGTLRQGLVDGGVTDKVIYDGDWVVWTADTFTNWGDGDNWFVLPADDVRRITQEEENFLAQVTEQDTPVDVRSEADGASDALVWITNQDVNGGILSSAPFLVPTDDTGNNPGGNAYIGGRELQNSDDDTVFQSPFGNPLATGLMYVVVSSAYLSSVGVGSIYIQRRDFDGTLIAEYSLGNDFNADIFPANSTGRYFVYSEHQISDSFSQVRIHSGETIRIITRTQDRHFRLNATRVDLTQNIADLQESQLEQSVIAKLNNQNELTSADRVRLDAIEEATENVALPNDFGFKVKFGDPSHVESDYRTWNADDGLLQDFQQTTTYTIRVNRNQAVTGTVFTGTGTITLTELLPSLFANERMYTVTIPPAPDDINYDPLSHPITFTGTQDNITAVGLVPDVKVDVDNFDQNFLDRIINHADTGIPAPLLALNNQARVFTFDNTDFVSNNDHAGIGAMFSFLKNRPDERLGDPVPSSTTLFKEITNSDITATIDDVVGLFYPRDIGGTFDNGVDVTTNGALVGPGAVNEPVTIVSGSATNFRLVLGFWFDTNDIPENTIRNLIRVKDRGAETFRRLFGLEGFSRIGDSGRVEQGVLVTERIEGVPGTSVDVPVTHNLYTTNGELIHVFSGVGAAETLFRVNEARTYTFSATLTANGNNEGTDTFDVTISNINSNQDLGQHTLNFTASGFPHSQVVNVEYVANTTTYGGPGHTLRFELNGGLTDNVNFDIDHLAVSCHYTTTETITTPTSYAEANAGGTPLIQSRRKHRAIFSFRANEANDNLQCHYVMTGFDGSGNPIVSESNIIDFGYSAFDLDWTQVRIGNNSSVIQNIQGYFLNTDTPLAQFPTHAVLNGYLTSHDDKTTDYVWDNASAPDTDIEAVYFPENVVFDNQILQDSTNQRWRLTVDTNGTLTTTKVT